MIEYNSLQPEFINDLLKLIIILIKGLRGRISAPEIMRKAIIEFRNKWQQI